MRMQALAFMIEGAPKPATEFLAREPNAKIRAAAASDPQVSRIESPCGPLDARRSAELLLNERVCYASTSRTRLPSAVLRRAAHHRRSSAGPPASPDLEFALAATINPDAPVIAAPRTSLCAVASANLPRKLRAANLAVHGTVTKSAIRRPAS